MQKDLSGKLRTSIREDNSKVDIKGVGRAWAGLM
jgi:hypothetical protein